MHDKAVRRRRAVLVVLVAASLILLTAYYGESSDGRLHAIQRGALGALSPIQEGAARVFKPVRADIWRKQLEQSPDNTLVHPVRHWCHEHFAIDQLPGLSGLLGRDVSRDTLSWGRAAGGIVSTTGDMTRWERALYTGRLLPPEQQAELTSLVSVQTGEPIAQTSLTDPGGYGLGVAQLTAEELGTFWTYTGGTWGFRTLHVYLPESGLIIAVGLNSRPVDDQMPALLLSALDTLVEYGVVAAPSVPFGAAA